MATKSKDLGFADTDSPFNLAVHVLQAGLTCPNKPALEILGGAVWTHDEIRQKILSAANGLLQLGLKPSDKVMIRLGNRVEFPIAYLACIWAGIVPVPTSAQLTEAEISRIAEDLQPDLILFEDGVACPKNHVNMLPLEVFQSFDVADEVAPDMGDPERLAYVIYTSGTSGKAKGVCHAHRAIWARKMMIEDWCDFNSSDRILHAGSFNWSYTMGTGLIDPWTLGATALIPSAEMAVEDLADHLNTSQPTVFAAVPGVYRRLLKLPTLEVSAHFRHGLSAGEALPDAIRSAWRNRTNTDIHEALGMSECSTFVSGSPNEPAPVGCAGRAQRGRRIAVLDEAGRILGPDKPGTLAVHRSDFGFMKGYLGQPLHTDEWFKTGDTVSVDAEGWLTYLGRNDDIITAGGFRISPLEIEDCFATIEGIEDCAATSVEIKAGTSVVALFYSSATGINEQVMRDHAQSLLAQYKQPRLYIRRDTLPKGANGKLNRRALRTTFEANR